MAETTSGFRPRTAAAAAALRKRASSLLASQTLPAEAPEYRKTTAKGAKFAKTERLRQTRLATGRDSERQLLTAAVSKVA